MRLSEDEEAAEYLRSAKDAYSLGHYKTAADLAKQAVYASPYSEASYVMYYFSNLRSSKLVEGSSAEEYKNAANLALSNLKNICVKKSLTLEQELDKFLASFPETKEWLKKNKDKATLTSYTTVAFLAILAFWASSTIMRREGA